MFHIMKKMNNNQGFYYWKILTKFQHKNLILTYAKGFYWKGKQKFGGKFSKSPIFYDKS
jgi:hypothetical protein